MIAFLICFFTVTIAWADNSPFRTALVESFVDHQKITAVSERDDWEVGEILSVVSRNAKLGVIGFVEVNSIRALSARKFEIRLRLLRQSRKYFIQTGDVIRRMDLTVDNNDYIGTTDLLIKQSSFNVSSKYRPLTYQGIIIGDTAQTLYKKEMLVNYFGNFMYGYNEWLTVGTLIPANVFGKPNGSFKARVHDTEATTLSTGLSFVRITQNDEASLNWNLYWDSTSSEALISHTFVSVGLVKWEKAAEATAIKALGSSSFQTGYEVILNSWDRLLVGPSYNFEKKALGGYLSYVWIMNRMHVQVSANATDITKLKFSASDGYYGFFEMYWRF